MSARQFQGSATTDRIVTPVYAAAQGNTQLTLCAWTWLNNLGGGSLGRIILWGSTTVEWNAYIGSVSAQTRLRFDANRWGTTAGQWYGFPNWTFDTLKHVAITYDFGSTSNDPVFYDNGVVSGTNVEVAAPAGSLGGTAAGNIIIGNNAANNRTFHGALSHVAVWSRILTAGEIKTVMHTTPRRVPSGLVFHAPLMGLDSPEPIYTTPGGGAASGTVTGAIYSRRSGAMGLLGFDDGARAGGFTAPPAGGTGARAFVAGMIG